MSIDDLHRKTVIRKSSTEIKKFSLKWLGHDLRVPNEKITKAAMRWTPTGKRKREDHKDRHQRSGIVGAFTTQDTTCTYFFPQTSFSKSEDI